MVGRHFYCAALAGHLELVIHLSTMGVAIPTMTKHRITALHLAGREDARWVSRLAFDTRRRC